MANKDYVIAGAGIVGLSLALELERLGAKVTVIDAGEAMRQTSAAAAGMLAVEDAANPPELYELASYSAALYPDFLDRVAELSGMRVTFQTTSALDAHTAAGTEIDARQLVPQLAAEASAFRLLNERSIDPRQLGPALVAAVRATSINLRERTAMTRIEPAASGMKIRTTDGDFDCDTVIDCMGSWSPAPVAPRKGQMLSVRMPAGFELASVVRTPEVYIVPRTEGPNAGLAIIGATVEDVGFDLQVHALDVLTLNARAVKLLPGLARADFVESWAGLRPATADGLPILGAVPRQPRYVLATGHFRNGILLAPGTARAIAALLGGEAPPVGLQQFSPIRF